MSINIDIPITRKFLCQIHLARSTTKKKLQKIQRKNDEPRNNHYTLFTVRLNFDKSPQKANGKKVSEKMANHESITIHYS